MSRTAPAVRSRPRHRARTRTERIFDSAKHSISTAVLSLMLTALLIGWAPNFDGRP